VTRSEYITELKGTEEEKYWRKWGRGRKYKAERRGEETDIHE